MTKILMYHEYQNKAKYLVEIISFEQLWNWAEEFIQKMDKAYHYYTIFKNLDKTFTYFENSVNCMLRFKHLN